MIRFASLLLASTMMGVGLTTLAVARTVHMTLDHCMVTWGTFCPVESIGGTVLIGVAFVLVATGFRFLVALVRGPAKVDSAANTYWEPWALEAIGHIKAGDVDKAVPILERHEHHPQAIEIVSALNRALAERRNAKQHSQ
jgi:hypothetical protein